MRTLAFLLAMTFGAGFFTVACGCHCDEASKYPPVPKATDDAGAPPPMKACTMEAKMCPDGTTSVGRQGPNCEFAPCPGAK